jgi:hypothetical protein
MKEKYIHIFVISLLSFILRYKSFLENENFLKKGWEEKSMKFPKNI